MLFIHKMIFNIFVLNELYSELLMLGVKTFSIVFTYSTLVCGLNILNLILCDTIMMWKVMVMKYMYYYM